MINKILGALDDREYLSQALVDFAFSSKYFPEVKKGLYFNFFNFISMIIIIKIITNKIIASSFSFGEQ